MSSVSAYPYNISLKIKCFDIAQLHKICTYVTKMCEYCGAQCLGLSFLPVKKKHISVCRSPHIHKKSRTQLVYKRHKAIVCFGLYKTHTLQETLFFFKTSILPGVEYELCITEKAYIL